MSLYFIQCKVDESRKNQITDLKERHLNYIGKNLQFLDYGGVIENVKSEYMQVLYFFKALDENDARMFVNGDPYSEVYKEVEISIFSKKI